MREILFRAKRVNWESLPKEEWWVEGCLLIDYVSGQYFIHAYGNSVNENDKVNEEGCLKFFAYEVGPETVCQYTGLTNGNGRKIFEGDVFQADDGECLQKYAVIWDDDSLEWIADCIGDLDGRLSLAEFGAEEIDVIGNIFDNP